MMLVKPSSLVEAGNDETSSWVKAGNAKKRSWQKRSSDWKRIGNVRKSAWERHGRKVGNIIGTTKHRLAHVTWRLFLTKKNVRRM